MSEREVSRAELFVLRAASDVKIARRELVAPDPASDAVCFHFQQAAEKLLKAYLASHEIPFPKTHNIAILVRLCEQIDPGFEELADVVRLTEYAVIPRYADFPLFPTSEQMQEADRLAGKVEDFVLTRLRASGAIGPET